MAVYFIGEIEEPNCFAIKIGKAKVVKRRLRDLQTGNPLPLQVLGWVDAEDDFRLEADLHQEFQGRHQRGEWFRLEPAEILDVLRRAGRDGYVEKNADSFEVVGLDEDAVPEYMGVWAWDWLEPYECCPFCGCFCGMHYQEALGMHHCLNCDTLTDFSELSQCEADESN